MHNPRFYVPATESWSPQPMQQQAQQVQEAQKAAESESTDPPAEETQPAAEQQEQGLGESGLRALAAERDERKRLAGELASLKKGLSEAFGIKPDSSDGDTLTTLQAQVQQMQHESSVLRLANTYRITDKDDLELLGTAKDAGSMESLAKRLAPSEDSNSQTPGSPKPDLTQGGKGDPPPRESLPGVPRLAQAFDDEINNPK